jgi:translation initiation factor 3 subunit F
VCRFSTGFGVSGGSTLIHDFYSREVQNPIHLTVDTGFTRGEASIKAYISSNLSLGDRHLAAQFQEIPLDLRMIEAEKAGCMCHFSDFFYSSYAIYKLFLSTRTEA